MVELKVPLGAGRVARYLQKTFPNLSYFTVQKALREFPEIPVYYDDFEENVYVLGRRMYVDHEKLPLILVTDGRLNGIYAASGYNVGTGDMLLRILEARESRTETRKREQTNG